ncbi:MAG: DUF4157 domain-containing protein [Spirosomataceae bacterium]
MEPVQRNPFKDAQKTTPFDWVHQPTLQTKLKVNPPGDRYEQEADQMAEQVVQTQRQPMGKREAPPKPLFSAISPLISRQTEEEEEQEEVAVQAKEEDEMAEEENVAVQAQAETHTTVEAEEVAVQSKEEETESVMTFEAAETQEETVQSKNKASAKRYRFDPVTEPTDQAPSNWISDGFVTPLGRAPPQVSFENRLKNSLQNGQSLPDVIRIALENQFGVDFGGVRVHTDAEAQSLCQEIHALAFTYKGDIFFNESQYNPQSEAGLRLLAHELTHTVQQGAALPKQQEVAEEQFTDSSPPDASKETVQLQEDTPSPDAEELVEIQEKPIDNQTIEGNFDSNPSPENLAITEFKDEFFLIQAQADGNLPRPELLRATDLAQAEVGKVNADKKNDDGTRVGWQRLLEYFKTSLGPDKVKPAGQPIKKGEISEENIRHYKRIWAKLHQNKKTDKAEGWRDAMPSWCGIFTFWALKKAGIPLSNWKIGQSAVSQKAAYPHSHIPTRGDIAYRNSNAHYAIVVKSEPQEATAKERSKVQVTTVNGNTTGNNNLGGQIEVKSESIARWTGFFNPLYGLENQLPANPSPYTPPSTTYETQQVTPAAISPKEKPKKGKKQKKKADNQEESLAKEKTNEPSDATAHDKMMGEKPNLNVPPSAEPEAPAKVEATQLTGPSEAMVGQVSTLTPSKLVATYPSAGGTIGKQITTDNQKDLDAVPPLEAKTGGIEGKLSTVNPELIKPDQAELPNGSDQPQPDPLVPEPVVVPTTPKVNPQLEKDMDDHEEGDDFFGWIRSIFPNFMKGVQTSDPDLDTSAGERPKTDLSADADPKLLQEQSGKADGEVETQKNDAHDKFKNHPGQEKVQPIKVDESVEIEKEAPPQAEIETTSSTDADNYAQMALPEQYRKAADDKMAQKLQPKLDSAATKANEAKTNKEEERKTAVDDAQNETKRLNEEADGDQRKQIMAGREEIATEQRSGMDDANQAMKDFKKESSDEKQLVDKDVKDKVKTENESAEKSLTDAEKECADRKKKDEEEAARKKKEIEEKEKDESWWDSIKSAVKKAVKALTNLVKDIFDKLRKFVKETIEKARKWAVELVEKCRKWVVDKIDGFRKWLKDKVNKYVGEYFPGLAKRINAAIDKVADSAIAKVNQIANDLKKGINALAKALTAALDKLLAKFQTFITAAIGIVGAVLTGDFVEALKIAFFAACEIAGIDPNPLMDFINKAISLLTKIFKEPGKFISNVGKGIKGGLELFWKNITKHLINGVIAWLTGAMSEVPIKLPEVWDAKGILHLVLQILGLTYDNIRAKVVKRLGANGEQIVSTIEKTFDFVKRLITEGPKVLWEMAQDALSNLKDMLISQLTDWLTTTIIKEGIMWLISLTNPASALGRLLKMLFDVAMFFVERFQQIKEFAVSVYNTIADIANGNVGKMSMSVEGALARTIPVVLGLLASLLGLSGIGKAVTEVIKKIRKPIDKAVDKVLDKIEAFGKKIMKSGPVKKLVDKGKQVKKKIQDTKKKIKKKIADTKKKIKKKVKDIKKKAKAIKKKVKKKAQKIKDKVKDKIKAVFEWWKASVNFKGADNESHKIYFSANNANAKLMVASNPQPFRSFLETVDVGKNTKKKAAKTAALGIADQIDALRLEKLDPNKDQTKEKKKKETKMKQLLKNLSKQTVVLFGDDLPDYADPVFGGKQNEFGTSMKINPLVNQKAKAGSPPSADTPNYGILNQRRQKGGASYYIKGHLLNETLGGTGADFKNLTPLSRDGNHQHEGQVESLVKAAFKSHAVIEYNVSPSYKARSDKTKLLDKIDKSSKSQKDRDTLTELVKTEDYVPHELKCTANRLEKKGKNWTKKDSIVSKNVPNAIERTLDSYHIGNINPFVPVKINLANATEIARIPGVTKDVALKISKYILRRDRYFGTYEGLASELGKEIDGLKAATVRNWHKEGYISLSLYEDES